jgi:hypothetical protein
MPYADSSPRPWLPVGSPSSARPPRATDSSEEPSASVIALGPRRVESLQRHAPLGQPGSVLANGAGSGSELAGPGEPDGAALPPAARFQRWGWAYEVLGLPAEATATALHAAYRAQCQRYHPDKVAHLAPEFRALAEARMRQINHAFTTLQGVLAGPSVASPAPAPASDRPPHPLTARRREPATAEAGTPPVVHPQPPTMGSTRWRWVRLGVGPLLGLVSGLVVALLLLLLPGPGTARPLDMGLVPPASGAGASTYQPMLPETALVAHRAPVGEAAVAPQVRPAALAEEIERGWNRDWPRVIAALEQLRDLEPAHGEWAEKLYAAYVAEAVQLIEDGQRLEALPWLDRAEQLDPARGVAQQHRSALTPARLGVAEHPGPRPDPR